MAERIYAFEAYAVRATGGVTSGAGVTIAPLRPASMLNVRGAAGDAFGIALPKEPNTALGHELRALWLGPDEWLLVNWGRSTFSENSTPTPFSVTDVSSGRAGLRLRGPRVRDALAKGCPLDLDRRVFPEGRCAQTLIGRVSVILDHVESDVFDVYVSRSYAGSLWDWMIEACAEYRYAIAPPE